MEVKLMNIAPLMTLTGVAIISATFAVPAAAQTVPLGEPVEITDSSEAIPKKRRIIKKVEPIPYWVDADQLRIRDNPVAGDVNGMLKIGQKVKAYEVFEGWLRISKPGVTEQWVNADYLTTQQTTWARFDNVTKRRPGFNRSNVVDDVSLKRIKVPDNKDIKVYAASIKKTANNNRVIVTRQNFRSGPHFEKRLVACGIDKKAERVQLLGEGYNYMMMEKDIRGQDINVNTAVPRRSLEDGNFSAKTLAVANFSCR
jgi:hypothetical protein